MVVGRKERKGWRDGEKKTSIKMMEEEEEEEEEREKNVLSGSLKQNLLLKSSRQILVLYMAKKMHKCHSFSGQLRRGAIK